MVVPITNMIKMIDNHNWKQEKTKKKTKKKLVAFNELQRMPTKAALKCTLS